MSQPRAGPTPHRKFRVAGLVASLNLPRRLSEVGVDKDRFREIAEKSMHDRAAIQSKL